MTTDDIPTTELLAYARQRIADVGLIGAVYAGVFVQVDLLAPMLEITPDHPRWYDSVDGGKTWTESNPVSLSDEMAWFECRKFSEVDRAIELFSRSQIDNVDASNWGKRELRAA